MEQAKEAAEAERETAKEETETKEEARSGVLSALLQLGRANLQYLRAQLEALELYPGQPQLLLALRERENVSQSALAQAMEITPATLTVMLQRMDAKQLVCRRSDPQDMRVTRLSLTEKGWAKVREIDAVIRATDARLDAIFTPEELTLLKDMLRRMHDALGEMGKSGASE